jgi:hypothetical protein
VKDNPYQPPVEVGVPSLPLQDPGGSTFSRPVLACLCVMIGAITWLSTSTGVPTFYSPFPLLVILPAFLGIPIPLIAIASAALFAASLFRHFQGSPGLKPSLGLTVTLLLTTGLTALWIIGGWSYGVRYQGTSHTIAITIANVIFAGVAWCSWSFARMQRRYRTQVAFSFSLFAWMFWYALPYLGELP